MFLVCYDSSVVWLVVGRDEQNLIYMLIEALDCERTFL